MTELTKPIYLRELELTYLMQLLKKKTMVKRKRLTTLRWLIEDETADEAEAADEI